MHVQNSLAVQWLGFHASTSGGTGSIPHQGTKIPHATVVQPKKKKMHVHFTTILGALFQTAWFGF